jgi:hypothetical protein
MWKGCNRGAQGVVAPSLVHVVERSRKRKTCGIGALPRDSCRAVCSAVVGQNCCRALSFSFATLVALAPMPQHRVCLRAGVVHCSKRIATRSSLMGRPHMDAGNGVTSSVCRRPATRLQLLAACVLGYLVSASAACTVCEVACSARELSSPVLVTDDILLALMGCFGLRGPVCTCISWLWQVWLLDRWLRHDPMACAGRT